MHCLISKFLLCALCVLCGSTKAAQQPPAVSPSKPNVLWLLTDDQRYDSIQAFNRILHNRDHSELGYVESPQVDHLAAMGTTFINTYCQAMGCAPSRASMHYGRYPFRSGIYEFEYHNNNAEHCRPSLPESMATLGYQTLHVGKLGVRIKTLRKGWTKTHKIYQTDIDFRTLSREGLCDWGKDWISQINGEKLPEPFSGLEFFVTPKGKFEYCSLELEKLKPEFAGTTAATIGKYDLLRHFNPKKGKAIDKGMIIAGVSPRKAGKTRDGYYSSVFADYLKNSNREFKVGSKTFKGVDTSKPLFAHIGYDFPHTPVLPPADYRARFQRHKYKIPQVDPQELKNMPEQLKRQVAFGQSDHLTDAQKLAMIQDYYAFCAYGDTLIGQAVDAFIKYSKQQKQPWMIVYVCGDHGWKLNEHGSVSKFTPWDLDSHNPIIVVSSDKQTFPAGKVVKDFTEFVDIAPTILAAGGAPLQDKQFDYLDGHDLAKVASDKIPARDYVIGESHAVTGPRAYIRTKEYVFSMRTRPDRNRGKNMQWALTTDYKDLDPALYHMPTDPHEVDNLAFSKKHQPIAQALKEKLTRIVLGDNRVEINWGPKADGTNIHRSNFAPGAHDGVLTSLSRAGSSQQSVAASDFGVLIFHDDFERSESQELKDEPGNDWTTSSDKTAGGRKQVDLRNGAMYMHTAEGANHAVSVRQAFSFSDGTVGMRFMLENDGDKLQLNFADMKLKTVHAGHLFDAKVGLTSVSFEDKKTGFMNLKIRAANKAKTLPAAERAKLLKTKRKTLSHRIKKGAWHDLLVHVAGDQISVVIDGNEIGSFRSEGFAHPTKGLLRLLTPGHSVVDDVKIWRKR